MTIAEMVTYEMFEDHGYPCLTCSVEQGKLGDAALWLAKSIATRRLGGNPRLLGVWSQHLELATPVDTTDLDLLIASLLQNIGTPDAPAAVEHLRGLVAEALWFEVVRDAEVGPGLPIRTEGHDWSVTDPGGDGLTIYWVIDHYQFRLWESKATVTGNVHDTVNHACRQLRSNALSYLARFSMIHQRLSDMPALAAFYGRLPELWVNRDASAGAGIAVAASVGDVDTDFAQIPTYFDFTQAQHQGQLHVVGDFGALAGRVAELLWTGCGIWNEP